MNMTSLIKTLRACVLILLASASFFSRAELVCGFNSSRNDTTGLDFKNLPKEIPTNTPVGTVIYTNNLPVSIWCAKKIDSQIAKGPEDIYINTYSTSNVLGSKSGLSVFITVNGDRDYRNRQIKTGLSTDIPYVTGLNTDNYLSFEASISIEVVKTSENVELSPIRNDVKLFSIGSSGSGYLDFYLRNLRQLTFTTHTCEVLNGGDYNITLPTISSSHVHGIGTVENHNTDFEVNLKCNSNLWSTLGIHMSLSGENVPGLESEGVFYFKNKETMDNSNEIAAQIFHREDSHNWNPVDLNRKIKIGEFGIGISTIAIPLRAAYYALSQHQTAGEFQSTVIYTISYE